MWYRVRLIVVGARLRIGGRGKRVRRLAFVAIGLALSVAVLLAVLGIGRALDLQQKRLAARGEVPSSGLIASSASRSGTLLRTTARYNIKGQPLVLIAIAAKGESPPVPPGVPHLPAPGEVFVSPALWDVLENSPEAPATLRALIQGEIVGHLEKGALLSPDEWVAVVGYDVAVLQASGVAQGVTQPIVLDTLQLRFRSPLQSLFLPLGSVGLLVPCLLLTATAVQVIAAERAQLLATLRLIGATSGQLRWLLAGEAAAAGSVGALIGLGLALVLQSLIPVIPFFSERFFASDLNPGLPAVAVVLASGPLLGVAVALIAVRQIKHSPLDVLRRTVPRPPASRRLALPVAGSLGLVLTVWRAEQFSEAALVMLELGFLLITLIGIVVAGPLAVRAAARWLGRRALPSYLWVASQRISGNPSRSFRLVSAILLSVFLFGFLKIIGPSMEAAEIDEATPTKYRADVIVELRGSHAGPLMEELAKIPGVDLVVPYGYGEVRGKKGEIWHLMVGDCHALPRVMQIRIEGTCSEQSVFVHPDRVPSWLLNSDRPLRLQLRGASQVLQIQPNGQFSGPSDGSQLLVPPMFMGEGWEPLELLLETDGREQTYLTVLATVTALQPAAVTRKPAQSDSSFNTEAGIFQTALSLLAGLAVLISCVSLGQSTVGKFIEDSILIAELRAIGMTRSQLRQLFIGETMFLVVLVFGTGAMAAMIFGNVIALAIGNPVRLPLWEIVSWMGIILLGSMLGVSLLWRLWTWNWTGSLYR